MGCGAGRPSKVQKIQRGGSGEQHFKPILSKAHSGLCTGIFAAVPSYGGSVNTDEANTLDNLDEPVRMALTDQACTSSMGSSKIVTKVRSKRPKRILLIRHGESEANVNRNITQEVPDHALHLTAKGREQAIEAGERLRELTRGEHIHVMISPYVRTRETFNGIRQAFGEGGLEAREDVQMREQDFGNFDKPHVMELHKEKVVFGRFYYRFPEGESLADVYNRASLFLESLYRQWEYTVQENLVLISHGNWLHTFLMRIFGYSVEQFYELDSIRNCEIIVLEPDPHSRFYEIVYTWPHGETKQYAGLRTVSSDAKKKNGLQTAIWDGDPTQEMIISRSYAPRRPLLEFFTGEHLRERGVSD